MGVNEAKQVAEKHGVCIYTMSILAKRAEAESEAPKERKAELEHA